MPHHFKTRIMNSIVKMITSNGIVAAIYFLLTFFTSEFSFGAIQVRLAECLVLLCFFRRDYAIGVTLGCVLANLLSPLGPFDVLFGGLATLISCLLISILRNLFFASIIPSFINAFVVGAELYYLLESPFWYSVLTVFIGEFIAISIVGYIIFMIIGKKDYFLKAIRAERNFNFRW